MEQVKKKAIVTVGVSASGKSTWAQEFCLQQAEIGGMYFIVERDKIRANILVEKKKTQPGDGVVWAKWNWKWEDEVTARADDMISKVLTDDNYAGVILSDTNLNPARRKTLVNQLTKKGFEVEEKFFDITWAEAVKRDNARKNGVGLSVLAEQFARLQKINVKQYEGDPSLPKAIIVDIDGTLAHMQGRSAFAWDRVGEDAVDDEVRDVVAGLKAAGYKVIIMSGRDGVCRGITEEWLKEMAVPYDEFFIRTPKDMRKDDIIKSELFWANVATRYNVKMVIDDRPQVCRGWRAMGLKVMQVGNPYIEF